MRFLRSIPPLLALSLALGVPARGQSPERPAILFPAGTIQVYSPTSFTLEQTDSYILIRFNAGPNPPTPVPPTPPPVPPTPPTPPVPPRPPWLPDNPPTPPPPTPLRAKPEQPPAARTGPAGMNDGPQAGRSNSSETPNSSKLPQAKIGPWEWRPSVTPGMEAYGRAVDGEFLVKEFRPIQAQPPVLLQPLTVIAAQ